MYYLALIRYLGVVGVTIRNCLEEEIMKVLKTASLIAVLCSAVSMLGAAAPASAHNHNRDNQNQVAMQMYANNLAIQQQQLQASYYNNNHFHHHCFNNSYGAYGSPVGFASNYYGATPSIWHRMNVGY